MQPAVCDPCRMMGFRQQVRLASLMGGTVRLCTLEVRTNLGWSQRLGLILSDNVLDLNLATAWRLWADGKSSSAQHLANALVPPTMLGFIQAGKRAMEEAAATFDRWATDRPDLGPNDETLLYPRDEVRLITPLPNPPSLRDFYSFEQHVTCRLRQTGRVDSRGVV